MADQQALGADDYGMLTTMLTSGDEGVRAQGQALAKKLTPSEQQEFFTFQKQQSAGRDATSQRVDSNIAGTASGAGIAPEDALIIGQAGRSIAQAASGGAMQGIKAAVSHASPFVRFEATRAILESFGVPPKWAAAGASAVAMYGSGAKGGAAETTSEATVPEGIITKAERPNGPIKGSIPAELRRPSGTPEAEALRQAALKQAAQPAASVEMPAEFAPTDAPVARASGATIAPAVSAREQELLDKMGGRGPNTPTNTLPDQKALNEAALAQRRAAYQASLTPSAPEFASKEERTAFLRLVDSGLSRDAAAKAVLNARALAARLGTPSDTEAAAAIAARQYKR